MKYPMNITKALRALAFAVIVTINILAEKPCLAVDVFFNYIYDASFTSNAGVHLADAQADFDYVGSYIGSIINSTNGSPVTVNVDVSGLNNPTSSTLASAGSLFYTTPNSFQAGLTQMKIQGVTPTWSVSEAVATLNFAYNWGYGGVVASNQLDFRYVLLHEMFHALGFNSLIGSNGQSYFGSNNFSYYDRFIYGWDGSQYVKFVNTDISGNPTGTMANAAGAVVDNAHPLLFNGPNVVAELGQPAQLYTPATFAEGSSISHYNYPGQLEYFAIPGTGPLNFGFSSLDLAFLKDFGYVVVPEPGSMLLGTFSMCLMVFLVRRTRTKTVD